MLDYVKCGFFWAAFICLLYLIGSAVTKKEQNDSYKFVMGYIVYSAIIAIGGIVVQFLNLPWVCFAIYIICVVFALVVFSIIRVTKKRECALEFSLRTYIKENWVLLLIVIAFAGMLFFYYNAYWYGNHLDDGYYVTKVATMPFNETGFRTNYSVGVLEEKIDVYILSTWELEASVYVKLLGVSATLFLRLFQSSFHYFLLLNIVMIFSTKIISTMKSGTDRTESQYTTIGVLLFGCFYLFLQDTNLFFVRDAWQFNSAMFMGSSIVRVMGILMLFIPFLDLRKIQFRTLIGMGTIAFVLISKSGISLPIIIIMFFANLISWLLLNARKNRRYISVILMFLWLVVGIILPNGENQQMEVYNYALLAIKSPVLILCVIIFVISFFIKNKFINRINVTIVILIITMTIPQINDVFEVFSIYGFVSGRAWTTLVYSFIVLNFIYFYVFLKQIVKKELYSKFIYGIWGIILTVLMIFSFMRYGGELFLTDDGAIAADMRYNLKVIFNNHDFVPNSTRILGEELEKISGQKKEKLIVISPEQVGIDNSVYTLATQLRQFAPSIVSVSANRRYPISSQNPLSHYNQDIYDQFVNNPDRRSREAFENQIVELGINCIVIQGKQHDKALNEMGFEQVAVIQNDIYYIWYKE